MIGQNDYVLSLPAINGHVASRHCAKHFPPANDRYIVNVYTSPKITPNATYDPYSITFASADMEGSGLPRYIAHRSKRPFLLNSEMYPKQARSSAFNMNNVYSYLTDVNVWVDQIALRAWHNDTLVFQHVPSVNAGGKVGFAAGAAAGTIFYGWKDGFTPIYNPEETLVDYSTDSAIYSSTRITPGDITKLEAYISAWDDPASAYASGIEVEVEIRSWNDITATTSFEWNVEWPYGVIHHSYLRNYVVNKPLYGLESLTNIYLWKMRYSKAEAMEIYDRGTFAVTDSSQLPKYDGGLVLNAENLPFGGAFLGSDNSVMQCTGVHVGAHTPISGLKCYDSLDLMGKTITLTDPEPNWSDFFLPKDFNFDVQGGRSSGLILQYLGKADKTTHLETIAGNNLTDGVTGWVTLFDRG